jgi:hypothetical protein
MSMKWRKKTSWVNLIVRRVAVDRHTMPTQSQIVQNATRA